MTTQNQYAFEHWNDLVQAVCSRLVTLRPSKDKPFFGNFQVNDFGGLDIADIRTNANLVRCEHGSLTRGDDRFYFLVLQRQGTMAIRTDREQFILRPGDLALLDSAQPYEMRSPDIINQLSVHLDRQTFDQYVPFYANRFGKLEHKDFHGQLLQSLLRQLSIMTPQSYAPLDPQHGASLQNTLITLLAPLLKNGPPLEKHDLRGLAERMIEQTLHEPLSPKELASRLKISVRQLHRQFEQGDETLQRYTLRRRLERCAQELSAPDNWDTPAAHIASQWGFSDSAYFSRAFKKRFGLPPAAYRARSKENQARLHNPEPATASTRSMG